MGPRRTLLIKSLAGFFYVFEYLFDCYFRTWDQSEKKLSCESFLFCLLTFGVKMVVACCFQCVKFAQLAFKGGCLVHVLDVAGFGVQLSFKRVDFSSKLSFLRGETGVVCVVKDYASFFFWHDDSPKVL